VPRQLPGALVQRRQLRRSRPRPVRSGFGRPLAARERAGTFEPLEHVPAGTGVVLGLVTTKSGELEDGDELVRRIDEASRLVPIENLSISPQCGFASEVQGNPLTWDDQRRKLDLVVSTAQRVWG
jgi:5-methyltetrahydropteroyltriglutamate--homocysteine methyltransferase